MDADDQKVKKLGVKFKAPPAEGGPMLKLVGKYDRGQCNHDWYFDGVGSRMRDVQYMIREGETEVECGHCGIRLDPMFVLRKLARMESDWSRTREAYQEEMARLSERQRTKCQNCGKMTRISRR